MTVGSAGDMPVRQALRVVRVAERWLWLEGRRPGACSQCSLQAGCGQALLDRMGRGSLTLKLRRPRGMADLEPGDWVMLSLPAHQLLQASARLYLGLLLGLLVGALVGAGLAGEWGSILGAAGGLALAAVGLRRWPAPAALQPQVTERLVGPPDVSTRC